MLPLRHALAGDQVALEEVADGLWSILFYHTLLGRFDQSANVSTGAASRSSNG